MTPWLIPSQNNSLEEAEVHIWLAHLTVSPPRIKQYYPLLSREEKERSERFVHFIHRKRFIASHGFMRTALATYLPCNAEDLVFKKAEKGKPVLVSQKPSESLHFNLSHSHNLALLAISKNKAVGIDVEYMDRKNEWKKIIQRFFTPEEQQALFSLPEDQQQQAFFKVWTRKEAHMKVIGEGLYLSPTQFTVSVPPEQPAFIHYINKKTDRHWQMQDIVFQEMFKDYCGCLSVEDGFSELKQFVFP